ncbi:MAG: Hpt domain-containing protein [Clostridia bacterium]
MKKKQIQALRSWECDVDGALERMCGDEELLLECARMVYDDAGYVQLGEAIARQDIQEAFDVAHSLKGIAANVGLTPLLSAVCDVVECLRAGQCDKLVAGYQQILRVREGLGLLLGIE